MRVERWLCAVALALLAASPAVNASGWAVYHEVITDSLEHDVLPAGSVTVAEGAGVSYRLLSSDSFGNFKADSSSNWAFLAGAPQRCRTVELDSGASTFDVCLQTDGGFTVQRKTGGATIEIVVRVIWISTPS